MLEEMRERAWDYATTLVLPAAVASLLIMLAVRPIGGRRSGALASMLAMCAGIFVSGLALHVLNLPPSADPIKPYLTNEISSNSKPWQLDPQGDQPFDLNEVVVALGLSLEEKPAPADGLPADQPEAEPPTPRHGPRYWVPWLAALAMLVEFLLPVLRIPAGPGWAVRAILALFAGRLLTLNLLRASYVWLPWAVGLMILLEWAVLTSLARHWRDGVAPTDAGLCLMLAAGVPLLVSPASAGEYALLFAGSLAGPALVSWIWPSDTSPVLAACAVILPGLVLQPLLDNEYKPIMDDYWGYQMLAAAAPLALLPMTMPFLAKLTGWRRWLLGLTLPLIPAVIAVVWAFNNSSANA